MTVNITVSSLLSGTTDLTLLSGTTDLTKTINNNNNNSNNFGACRM